MFYDLHADFRRFPAVEIAEITVSLGKRYRFLWIFGETENSFTM